MSEIANEYNLAGNSEEAVVLITKALENLTSNFGREHEDSLIAMNRLAKFYSETGRDADAKHLFEEAFQICRETREPTDTLYTQAVYNLALMYRKLGMTDDAEKLRLDYNRLRSEMGKGSGEGGAGRPAAEILGQSPK